jgi:membrane-associated protease RseP (regulator of RpoE activity)
MKPNTTPAMLAIALAALCTGGIAAAQTHAPAAKTEATEAQLDAARADLERAARRVAELSRKLGRDERAYRIERRMMGKPVLGVLLAPDSRAGVRIAGVTPESGAAAAGLKSGDRITSIDGKQVLGSSSELRVENARKLLAELDTRTPVKLAYERQGRNGIVSVTPRIGERVVVLPRSAGNFSGKVRVIEGDHGEFEVFADRMVGRLPGVAPRVREEIMRLGPECKGKDCRFPALTEAFRWNGLNLASVDKSLGRYFGTDRGVLVLSTGELAGLQAGDVIRKIDGTAVDSPREAMDVLHDKPADALVLVEYLRDRRVASTRVKVPKAMPFRMPAPPPPPAAPAAPRAPVAPPAPPTPAAASVDDVVILRDMRIAVAPEALKLPLPPEAPRPPEAPAIIDMVIETN